MNRLRQRRHGEDDEGFVLIYVLMIITIVTILVGSVLVVSASNAIPAVQSAYGQAADAAAEGGIQAFLADLDTRCSSGANSTVATCTPASSGSWVRLNQTGSYTASYKWATVAKTTAGTPYIRVTAQGRVVNGGVTVTRSLTADLTGGTSTSCLDYSVCTQYETQAPDVMAQQYPNRTINLSATARASADATSGSGAASVTWTGASTSGTAGSVNSCNTLYLGTNGREKNPPPGGSSYTDWTESTTLGGSSVTSYQPCQVSLGSSTKLLAPGNSANGAGGYYTPDALLVSNSNPGQTGGPLFNEPVYTGYAGAADASGTAGQNYRSFTLAGYNPQVGGAPAAASTYPTPQYVTSGPVRIAASPTIPASGACVYSGPTRVLLNANGTATITSPLTTTKQSGSPSGCYPSSVTGGIYGFTTAALSSITGFTGVISVLNSGTAPGAGACGRSSTTGWPLTCMKKYNGTSNSSLTTATAANTVFYKDSGSVPTSGDPSQSTAPYTCSSAYSAASDSTCAWTGVYSTTDGNGGGTNGWTSYTSGTNCSSTLASTDRLAFECDYNQGSVGTPHDYYGILRSRVRDDLARSTCLTGTTTAQQTCIQAFLTSELAVANNSSHRYVVTAATPVSTTTTKTLSANSAPLAGDPFFDSTTSPGAPSTESVTTSSFSFTISRQVYKCYGVVVLGLCLLNVGGAVLGYQWGSDTTAGASTPQFTVTVTNQNVSNFTSGSVGKSYFPYTSDVTPYAVGSGGATGTNGPGDLYVEGSASQSLALVANNDVIITGSLAPSSPSSAGLEVVGQNNVRAYHPVSCTSPESGTDAYATMVYQGSAGFCPNDLTGLYASIPPTNYRPYQQYANMRTDLAGMTINAAIFALGNAPSTVPCLQWQGSGVCGGQFSVDNYGRGTTLGVLSVTGAVVEVHHGALGEEWEVPDATGQTRPQSGYSLSVTYQNLKTLTAGVNTVDISDSTTSTAWHIISVSTGGS